MKIHDISMTISEGMIVYPGNPMVKIRIVSRVPKDATQKSEITFGSHTGTHIDARCHVFENDVGADKVPLESLYGGCKVLDLTKCRDKITAEDLQKHDIKKGDIILLKTSNSLRGYRQFYKDYVYIDDSAAQYLAGKKVKTVGIDYLSVKQLGNRQSRTHQILIGNMAVFEGLDLGRVKPGKYVFAGLPLKIKDCDGAPARAVLIEV